MFESYKHPRLVAVALAGAGWWILGLVLWLLGPPQLRNVSFLIHLLGLGTLVLTGLVYGFKWWGGFIRSKLE